MFEKIGVGGGIEDSRRTDAIEKSGWARTVGPCRHLEKVEGYKGVNERDLITLKTRSNTEVCPKRQFVITVDENGEELYSTDPYVGLLWRVTGLYDFGEWTRAARIFYPLQGETVSYTDRLLDPEATETEKLALLEEVIADEREHAIDWLGVSEEDFDAELQKILEKYDDLSF